MQTTSATYDRILAGTDCSYETRLIIDGVGTYGESDLMSISTNIEMFQEDPDIGKAISAEINVAMLNPSATIPTMARVRPQVRACGTAPKSSKVTIVGEDLASEYASYSSENITFSPESGATVAGENLSFAVDSSEYLESEWIAQGVYFIDTREVTQNNNGLDILTIHGFDAMLKTEQMYSSNSAVGDNLDVAYVRSIASAIGVSVDPRTWGIMQTGYMIPFPLGYSMREILGYIASAYAGCFIISDTGQLRLVALEDIESETRYLINEIGDVIIFGVDSPEHTVTASGAVATFTSGGEYALDELEIAIDPVQDLHGYDAPYPAGGGENILPPPKINGSMSQVTVSTSDDTITLTGTASAYGQVLADSTFKLPSGTYYFKYFVVSGTGTVVPQIRSTSGTTAYVSGNNSFTLSEETEVKARVTYSNGASFSNLKIKLMLSKGSTAPSEYADYSNICPISGWTGVNVEKTGKIWLKNSVSEVKAANTRGTWSGNDYTNAGVVFSLVTENDKVIAVKATGKSTDSTYCYIAIPIDTSESQKFKCYGCNQNGNTNATIYCWDVTNSARVPNWSGGASDSETGSGIEIKPIQGTNSQLRCRVQQTTDGVVNGFVYHPLIVLPAEYTTYPITFPDAAGTVYVGTLTINEDGSVGLTATHATKTFTSSSDISKISTTAWYIEAAKIPGVRNPSAGEASLLSDKFRPAYPAAAGGCFLNTGGAIRFNTADEYSDSSALMTALGSIQFVYPLATPIVYNLTAEQVGAVITTLKGQNNLWSNTGNIINLEFVEPATEAVRILV